MLYLNNTILCLTYDELFDDLIPVTTYRNWRNRNTVVFHGRGGNGSGVLIEYETLPEPYKKLVIARYGDPYKFVYKEPIRHLIKPDTETITWFEDYRFPNGKALKDKHRIIFTNNVAILKAIDQLKADKSLRKEYNLTMDNAWKTICDTAGDLRKKDFPNTIPTSVRRLKPLFNTWKKEGCKALISKKYLNNNSRKVDEDLENLLLSLYIQNNKPYAKQVHEIYELFMQGKIDVYDRESGELFDREKFYKDGERINIGQTTVWFYINKIINRASVDKLRTSTLEFQGKHRPHIHRHTAIYAFSKISMDDISIPFKMPDGTRVWSYQIYDTASQCIVGKSFGRDKNRELFMKAVKDMFRLIHVNGWGIPAEIEIEQHISNTFAEDLLKEGNVFPFVWFCRGGNPQEKRIERVIGAKKYSLQNKRDGFQRRPFARLEANRMNEDKDKVRYAYQDIVANETADINTWNNQLHPNQVLYPGKTRWQVLVGNQNPELAKANPPLLAKYIGHKTDTSIYRSQYVFVKKTKYQLPCVDCLNLLEANNLDVEAYYIPDAEGNVNEVHLFQNDELICSASRLQTFNDARAEQTEGDIHIRNKQFAYRTSFDQTIKDKLKKLSKVAVQDKPLPDTTKMPDRLIETGIEEEDNTPDVMDISYETDANYWTQKAIDDL